MINIPIISILIFIPIILGGIIGVLQKEKTAKILALGINLFCLVFSLIALFSFNKISGELQFVEKVSLVKSFDINYFVAFDGIGLIFTFLTALIGLFILVYSKNKRPLYYSFVLGAEGTLVGLFTSYDSLLFYIFLEINLVYMFFIIALWGGIDRIKAVFKYCMYSLGAETLLLVALLYIHYKTGTFDLIKWQELVQNTLPLNEQLALFVMILIALCVKVPLFLLHFWLPQTHAQAPTGGSVLLSGLLLKVGIIGIFRFIIPVFPLLTTMYNQELMIFSSFGIIYASCLALVEKQDIKKVIAYSSIVHMGFVLVGVFSLNKLALQGAVLQMVSHVFAASGLFFCMGMIFDRLKSRKFKDMTALQKRAPIFSFVFMILLLDTIGLPITGSFVGKLMTFLGAFNISKIAVIISCVALILGLAYMLRLYNACFLSEKKPNNQVVDLTFTELIVLLPIVSAIILLGLMPNIVFDFVPSSLVLM